MNQRLESDARSGTSSRLSVNCPDTNKIEIPASDSFFACASLPAREVPILETPVVKQYLDSRKGFESHIAVEFNLKVNTQLIASVLLEEFLGKNADILISGWGRRVDFTKQVSNNNTVVLFKESNRKPRNKYYAKQSAKTTQEDDFNAAGLKFADDLEATIVCAALVKKANDAGIDISQPANVWARQRFVATGKLNKSEIELLSMLKCGEVRTYAGSLNIDVCGRLRANLLKGPGNGRAWAFAGLIKEQ